MNVGVVAGGTRENVVAAEATAWIDVRVPTLTSETGSTSSSRARAGDARHDASRSRAAGRARRSSAAAGSTILFEQARARPGARPRARARPCRAGGSDGNLIGALGVPVLDGLGAQGAGAHAVNEHVEIAQLEPRAELLARLLQAPGL